MPLSNCKAGPVPGSVCIGALLKMNDFNLPKLFPWSTYVRSGINYPHSLRRTIASATIDSIFDDELKAGEVAINRVYW